MLIGTFLRDYKNYNSLVYVPIARTPQEMLTLYTGVNGVGKSAILEALNCFFNANAAQWNLRKGGKQEEALVAPVFLIPKSDDPSNEAMIKADEQWRKLESDPDVKSRAPAIEALVKHRESMGNLDEFYFFAVGYTAYSNYGEPISRIKSLMKALHLPDEKVLPYDTGQLLETVRSYYDYAYLPVESTAQDITNLQTLELQRIMGRTVSTELKKIFTGKEANAQSLLDRINSKLSSYMESINDEIKTIDSRYKYKTDQGVPGKLKAEELCQHILEQFIERRALKRDTVKISELSSGEQRQVLMDVLYAFLASDKAKGRHIILAIDEPEASLHMSKCFDQFRRASRLANEFRHQVLLTTHWYGFLPLSQEGVFHHLNNEDSKISFTSHSLRASIGDRGNFPDDVNLKSYFDFVSSILSACRSTSRTWLFCEGEDDAVYLRHFLAGKTKAEIVPLGGAGNVVKVYSYMYQAVKGKELDGSNVRMLFLYDTDSSRIPFEDMHSDCGNRILSIRRLQMTQGTVALARPSVGGEYRQTEMEDCLNAKPYFDAVLDYLRINESDLFDQLGEAYDFNASAQYARVSDLRNEDSFLKPKKLEALEISGSIYAAIMESPEAKLAIANGYVKGSNPIPKWVSLLTELLAGNRVDDEE